ncbi:hypothetical protein [Arthrobacter livingstonensis]|uniref:hypothetical protein n=1 Tax=Arthrobacter livingstonensis TaxID=670078 RepID=UPI0011B7237B|nr:hypothetical protein [Arthrobacter livingstonensis]
MSPETIPQEVSHPPRSTAWAESFEPAFASIDPKILGRVRFIHAVALNEDFVAVIYKDHFGILAGRIYSVTALEQGLQNQSNQVEASSGFILGDLIEPSPPGKKFDHELFDALNRQFPSIKWSGEIASFKGGTPF